MPRALLVLAAIAASCSVPSFGFGPDAPPKHCANLISDEGETGLDCGGTCPPCRVGDHCFVNGDCAGGQCLDGLCQEASCLDGMPSGSETDTDCGGGGCAPCATGSLCVLARDCASGVCTEGTCTEASCTDTIPNGDETDVDCGGSCSTCLPGQKCRLPTDCAGGDCTNGTCSLTCLEGKGNCDGNPENGCETNLKTATDHCGSCDTPCNLPHATARCSGGTCAVDTCTAPFADCDGKPDNGCETNTSTASDNCNGCGLACPAVNGTPSCVASACQITCAEGYSDCDDERSNGCEKKTDSDAANCGACHNVCDAGNGTPRCNGGVCGVSDCPAGSGDCDGKASNGCEADLTNDPDNCKICGSVCVAANGTPSCVAGACKVDSCDANHADCNGQLKDGCEKSIVNDPSNCGACDKVCGISNGTAKCEAKVCRVSSCTAPWADCDGNGTDCETNTSTNSANCGGCGSNGSNCNAEFGGLNASGKCLASACVLDKCAAGFADCNLMPDDGCETNLKTDSGNCGTCGTVCQHPNGSNTCNAGVCVPGCGSAFGDCDRNVKTGCEVVLTTDEGNCGACGTVCQQTNANNVCSGGACSPTCSQTYFKSCDADNDNGCEADIRTSKANCGACAKPCLDNQTSSNNCVGSACMPVCLSNHANCDANPNNGCETPTSSDPTNCGGCGVQCKAVNATGATCGGGVCTPACNNGFAACTTPAAGCLTSIDTAAHCGNCLTACAGAKPFCVSRACAARLDIAVVNSNTIGSSTVTGQDLIVPHLLQTAATANAYRLVVVGITGFGNGGASLPTRVQYGTADMTLAKSFASTNQVSAAIYYLQGAALPPNAGTYNVIVTSAGSNSFILTANVVEFINVEQATGALDAVGGQANSNSCSIHKPSDPVAVSAAGGYVYSVASLYQPGSLVAANSTGQTITEQSTLMLLGTLAGYLKAATAVPTTITWNVATCSTTAHALLSIKPALTP